VMTIISGEPTKDQIHITMKKRDFTQIENVTLRDEKLSLKAKGLLSLLLSFADNGNTIIPITTRQLAKYCQETHAAVARTMNELIEQKLCFRHQACDEKGRYSIVRYFVYETRELAEQAIARGRVAYSAQLGKVDGTYRVTQS
jgi:hypothetical protein